MGQYQYCNNVRVSLGNHEIYSNKEALAAEIEKQKQLINELKMKLFGMCCATPTNLYGGNNDDILFNISRDFDVIFNPEMEGLEYLIAHLVDLQYIYDNFDNTIID